MTIEEDKRRYSAAAHAMQSGVAYRMNNDPGETQPKHLRVGVNSAMVDTATIVKLLIAKGVITQEEFYKMLADTMEEEVARYQRDLPPNMTLR